jgi:transposase InsO family protein
LFTQADLGEVDGCQAINLPGQEAWMNVHKNARLTPLRRRELVGRLLGGAPVPQVAKQDRISTRTARKWWARFRREGVAGLVDRSSRPHRSPRQTAPAVALGIKALRRQRWTCAEIGDAVGVSAATVARVLRPLGLSRRGRCEAPPPVVRYEHARAGDLLHLDTKRLGHIAGVGHRITGHISRLHRSRGAGWQFLHVAIDDHSRTAYLELLPDEFGVTVSGFVRRAVAWFRQRRVRVRRILTDNGAGYRSASFRATCRALHARTQRTRPYTPRTNGKAERFIQTALREWAYRRPYYSTSDRAAALPGWLEHYNCARLHQSLGGRPPVSRLPDGNNLMLAHS